MDFDDGARRLAEHVRCQPEHFVTITWIEIKKWFGIQNKTERQCQGIVDALGQYGIVSIPHLYDAGTTQRLYDQNHMMGQIALAVHMPDETVDAPIRTCSKLIDRDQYRRELRSDDVPWLDAFGMMLECLLGREPDGWEDMEPERPPLGLAHALGDALGFDAQFVNSAQTRRLAAMAHRWRPIGRKCRTDEVVDAASVTLPEGIVSAVTNADSVMQRQRQVVLHAIAQWIRSETPSGYVEVGLLGLRRRREELD